MWKRIWDAEKHSYLVWRNASLILTIGTFLTVIGIFFSALLYKSLRPDLEQLLPSTARSVVDLNEVTERFQSLDHLAILIFSKDTRASKRFVLDLGRKLKPSASKEASDLVNRVEVGIMEELRFFNKRQALYLDLSDLIRIRNYIRERIRYESDLYNPLNIFSEEDIPEPKLDVEQLKKKNSTKLSNYQHFPDGLFATRDGTKRAILVYMNGKLSQIERVKRLRNLVDQAVFQLNPSSYAPDLVVRYTGELENMLEEQASLTEDLEVSATIVTILVSFVLILFFRAKRATFSLMAALLMGTAWTFGIAYFCVGFLNANSAFLGSIVIGNGINFGIIFLARYLEERRNGKDHLLAQTIAISQTASATWVAALAAGLSYGSLMLTDFRGFSQFGLIGLMGMVLCWFCSFTILPAFLSAFEKRSSLVKNHPQVRKTFSPSVFISRLVVHFPKTICIITGLATFFSLTLFGRINPDLVEADLGKARSRYVVKYGAGSLSHVTDEIFQRYLTPLVILPRTFPQTKEVRDQVKDEMKYSNGLIRSVQTIQDFIPDQQGKKIKVLKEIRSLVPPSIMRRLQPKDQKELKAFLSPEAFSHITKKDLPPLIQNAFTEKDGSTGKLVLVEPPVRGSPLSRPELLFLVNTLRGIADSVEPGIPVAGTLPISADVLIAIQKDGPSATLFALGAVIILVILLFRQPVTVLMTLTSLFLGVIWMTGFILLFNFKVNFLNFIAFPITFGIGVDYGVNIFQRYRQEGLENIGRVIQHTGGAVGVCSLTTIIGYGSLLLAQSQVFNSFGILAVVGEITCLVAAMVSLPALIIIGGSFKRRTKPQARQEVQEEEKRKAA